MAMARNGGLTAPATPQGAGRRGPRTGRQEEIKRAVQGIRRKVNPAGTGLLNPAGQGSPTPAPATASPPAGGGPGIGQNEQPGLGHQLSRRVSSGAITAQQAQRTAQQRQTFAKAYGPNWRQQVYGGAGKIQQARTAAKAGGFGPKEQLGVLLQKRQSMLAAAQKKLSGGGAGAGKPNPQGRGMMNPAGRGR